MPTETDARALIQALVSLCIVLVIMGVLLFWSAGSLSWGRGWWFLALFVICIAAAMLYLWQVNPDIFAARRGIAKGTKSWDLVIVPLVIGLLLATCVVAALDDGRFHWLPTPDWVVWLGYLLFLVGFGLTAWAQAVNRHFEPGVRIQTDRGHTVIDKGPYAIIRHPGYAAGIFLAAGFALALGSLWALVPAVLFQALLAYRTLREEEALHAELPGYTAYTQRVKFRWVPGVW